MELYCKNDHAIAVAASCLPELKNFLEYVVFLNGILMGGEVKADEVAALRAIWDAGRSARRYARVMKEQRALLKA